jgi:hypothetical protein
VRDKEKLTESMFESCYSEQIKNELAKCLRVMPHHQNTSGFFITIIEKTAEMNVAQPSEERLKELPLTIQELGDKKEF